MKRRFLFTGVLLGALSVTNLAGRVVSGTFVRSTRSHIFIRNADGVVRAMPYNALSAAERARVGALVGVPPAPAAGSPAQVSKGGKR